MHTKARIFTPLKSKITVGAITCALGVAALAGTADATTASLTSALAGLTGTTTVAATTPTTTTTVTTSTRSISPTTLTPIGSQTIPTVGLLSSKELCLGGATVTFGPNGSVGVNLGSGC